MIKLFGKKSNQNLKKPFLTSFNMKKSILFISMLICFSCSNSDIQFANNPSSTGTGGSTARFAVVDDFLYTVDENNLKLFNISQDEKPVFSNDIAIGTGIETIFPKGNTLFIGSQLGMYIYDISAPANPNLLSIYQHVFSCDPVVADDNYAYVTLRSIENRCGRINNQLDIVDIRDLENPQGIKEYPMTHPKGLSIDSNSKELFVCDDGLKVFDASDVLNLVQKQHFNIEANDVIALGNLLMVIGDDGLYQYDYSGNNLELQSVIPIVE